MKIRKRLALFALIGCMLFPANIFAADTGTEILSGSVERADNISWQYKTIDGKLYKRLYNYTTGKALSDWQLVT